MVLSKVLFSALTGSILIVVTLLGSWMSSVNSAEQAMTERIALAERHYAVIEQQLTDLREDVRDIKGAVAPKAAR